MTEVELTTARIASTPTQAKLFVALLKAEGIPAFIEGDSLADEVAVSRRLMNIAGTHIQVRKDALVRAQEVLADVKIDDDELVAQAMAAGPTEPESTNRNGGFPMGAVFLFTGVVLLASILYQVFRVDSGG